MILVALVISTVAFFLCFNLLNKNKALHIISSLFFLVLFLLSTLFITLNFHNHLGMHKVTFEKKSSLVSSVPGKTINALMYQNIGTSGKDQVVLYRANEKQAKPQATGTDKVKNVVVTNAKTPKLVTKTVKYEYKTSMDRFWFAWAQKPTRVKTVNYFYMPKDWMKLTVNQVKALPNIMKELSANSGMTTEQRQQAAQQYVQAAVAKAMQANPKMSASQKQQVIQKATSEYQAKAMSQMMPMVKQALKQVK
ncbi:DUF4811 domain-containing protein [Apilactobacillus bombintestini]|uniref:DUF4811 domain-containing protein n=1 Tax=Apilactobacillus bombintestini TaxID=2419772 RepID=A0A387AUU4_9LACO|nr:DUF4811 domain-containing protein [Apilactobacillus bombintestini]AYF92965.1 DUF4811 domain-containing protein [Apilactobacillus bombintestini]